LFPDKPAEMSQSAWKYEPEKSVETLKPNGDSESDVKVIGTDNKSCLAEQNSDQESMNLIETTAEELSTLPESGEEPEPSGLDLAKPKVKPDSNDSL